MGLSFPYEGPAPLEAIANGCAFLNPKFTPPKSSKNADFFKGKPTMREVRRGGGGWRGRRNEEGFCVCCSDMFARLHCWS